MQFFGYTIRRTADYSLIEKGLSLQESMNEELVRQNTILKQKVDGNKLVGVIGVDIGDPAPSDAGGRREFIARVAAFHKDILSPKLFQMISATHRLLEEETNDRETDLYLKMLTYVCRDLIKWGNEAINEQLGYQTNDAASESETLAT